MGVEKKIYKPKRSYSQINTFLSCGWRYKLNYEDKHFISAPSLANELGTTLHYIEEQIARTLQRGDSVDYEKMKNEFNTINIEPSDKQKNGIYGLDVLKAKYKNEFYETNQDGVSYYTKTLKYLTSGIYRLEKYLKENPDLEIYAMEKYFCFEYCGETFSGNIDRIFYNKKTGDYIIEDIKTKDKPFKDQDLEMPYQFVIYTIALADAADVAPSKIKCVYDLPFINTKQPIESFTFVDEGKANIAKALEQINKKNFRPHPSVMCYWCPFSPTNPDQKPEGKGLCPYYSLWTKDNRVKDVAYKWCGMEHHEEAMAHEKRLQEERDAKEDKSLMDDFDF